ncbi:hypothetical protein EYF80_020943 [Liparis tanakae]|uniref:Uncharacterized protein n=1 Tax=Liparis tanakae TaxID=230148 RepID=A0A4Z2HT25_9TELE|nr:hypothetical protein EYF80_020943 [Liparis tanakae]
MCEAQAAAAGPTNTRMSDVSGICAEAPRCLTTRHYTQLDTTAGPSVEQAGVQGTDRHNTCYSWLRLPRTPCGFTRI